MGDRGLEGASESPGAPLGSGVPPVLANPYGSASAGLYPELAAAGHLSIAHGRVHEPLLEGVLDALVGFLRGHIAVTFGRTYVGV